MSYHWRMEKQYQHNPPVFEDWDGVSPAIPRRDEDLKQPLSSDRASWPFHGIVRQDSAPTEAVGKGTVKRHSAPVGNSSNQESVGNRVAGPAYYKPLAPSEACAQRYRTNQGPVVYKQRGPKQRQPVANLFCEAARVDTPAESNRARRARAERIHGNVLRLESGFDVTVRADGLVAYFGG